MSLVPNVADVPGGAVPELGEAGQRLAWANEDGQAFSDTCKWFAEAGAYAVHVQREDDRWQASWHRLIEPDVEAEKFEDLP